jgi:hypothetical protein
MLTTIISLVDLLLTCVIGLTLAFAGLSKVWNHGIFAETIAALVMVPHEVARLLSALLGVAELLIGVACFITPGSPFTGTAVILLCLLFAIVSWSAAVSGEVIPCVCFGVESGKLGWFTFWRALTMCAAGLVMAFLPYFGYGPPKILSWQGLVVTLVCGAVFLVLIRSLQREEREKPTFDLVAAGTLAPEITGICAESGQQVTKRVLNTANLTLLFLDYRCKTCWALGTAAKPMLERSVTVVLAAPVPEAKQFIERTGLQHVKVVIDVDRQTHRNFGLKSNPVIVFIRNGRVAKSAMISEPHHIAVVSAASRTSSAHDKRSYRRGGLRWNNVTSIFRIWARNRTGAEK